MPCTSFDPHLFVIFGSTGDLAHRKLFPALFRLSTRTLRDTPHHILGLGRRHELDDESFRKTICASLIEQGVAEEEATRWTTNTLSYQTVANGSDYPALARRIDRLDQDHHLKGNRAFYLSLPPRLFPEVIMELGKADLHRAPGWARLVIEKPFGQDLDSALSLNGLVHRYFEESQVFRIDHYLGKDTVQNLLVFRFGNAIFESLWNRSQIDNIQITVAETIGVGSRAGYYDTSGALRDMVQNHLTQLFTLSAMEVPVSYDPHFVREEKVKVLRATRPIQTGNVVFGQYVRGRIDGVSVVSYREENGIPEDSDTETFVAIKLEVDNWRWQGVPFYLRSGKRLAAHSTEIVVTFKKPPVCLFHSMGCSTASADTLRISIQPDEGFSLSFDIKKPGAGLSTQKQSLDFRYRDVFPELPSPYVTLLEDILCGDPTLFVHALEVEGSWRLYTPLLGDGFPVHSYPAGSWGPRAARDLMSRDGRSWRGGS